MSKMIQASNKADLVGTPAHAMLHPKQDFTDSDGERTPAVYRKFLLRIVFWALGLAALFGAAGVIFAGHETLWRIVGTCCATAVGAFLLLSVSQKLDQEATWLPGMMAIALIVTEYLTVLGLVWNVFGKTDEHVALSMFILLTTAIPAIGFAALLQRPDGVVSARVGLVASLAVFVSLMVGTWAGRAGYAGADQWNAGGLWLAGLSLLAVLCLIGFGTDQRHWRWLGVAASGAAFAMAWQSGFREAALTSTTLVCLLSLAAVVAHANALAWCPLKPAQRWLLWATVGAGVATGFFVDLGKITSPWHEEMLQRVAGATAIMGGCGTLALLVLAKINQRIETKPATIAQLQEIKLTCPRCRSRQTIPLGHGACSACGLVIEVQIQSETI